MKIALIIQKALFSLLELPIKTMKPDSIMKIALIIQKALFVASGERSHWLHARAEGSMGWLEAMRAKEH